MAVIDMLSVEHKRMAGITKKSGDVQIPIFILHYERTEMKGTFYPKIPAFPDIFVFCFRHVWILKLVESVCVGGINSYAEQSVQRVITTQIYGGDATITAIEAAGITISGRDS